jgi:para-nitrobenzyl esterase
VSAPVVATPYGAVRGTTAAGVHTFKGIPYGADPTGPRRFRPPEPPEPWTGVLEATAYGPASPQPASPPWRLDNAAGPPPGESCLVLNVWTASLDGAKPVLVWLHGGGFSTGSGSLPWYEGAALAARGDVVVVTLNHRLGLLGFLDLGSVAGERFADAGHGGMLDLVAALGWVRDSIAGFGGDPGRVTVFGESGGGGKVCALLAMPAAEGLFHRAAVQSGVFLDGPGMLGQTCERSLEIAMLAVEQLGGVDALLAAPVERLLAVQQTIERTHRAGSGGVMPFCPIADGRVLTDHPHAALAAGASRDVPLLIGSNRDETTLFLWLADAGFRADPLGWSPTDAEVAERLAGYAGERVAHLIDAYRRLRPGISNRDLMIAISSDNMRIGALRMAEAKLRGGEAPVHVYRFDWESPVHGGALGAAHGFEIPFVFDTAERRTATREGAGREQLAREMSGAWASFAGGEPAVPGLGGWPAYSLAHRETIVFGTRTRLVDDPGREERLAWSA